MTWFWTSDQLEQLGDFLAERGLCGPTVSADAIGDGHSNLTFLAIRASWCADHRRRRCLPVPMMYCERRGC
jgi:hypothetical protein